MRLKISIKAKSHLNKKSLSSLVKNQMLEIAKDSMVLMRKRLNSTEEPDSDPRRKHINVKKWRVSIKSTAKAHPNYRVLLRAINTQAPTYYTAYRRMKNVGKVYQGIKKPHTINYDSREDRPLSREEYNDAMNYIHKTQEYARKMGCTHQQSLIIRQSLMKRYKKLVPVKVRVDNIAFSRLFSAKNVIRPNPSKYSPYDYAQCLKIWDGTKFRYVAHAYPKENNGNYYYSRLRVMKSAIEDEIRTYHD